jgi:arginyl-tRNA--protein-N-Asp/Glu arginylyltransferase
MMQLPLWLTSEQVCSYLPHQRSQSLVIDPDITLSPHDYSQLIAQGFRRSGEQVYRPYCNNCQACVPTRLAVNHFQPARHQKRCLSRNAYVAVSIQSTDFTPEHFELYQRYLASRHPDDADDISADDYLDFFSSSWCDTWLVEFRLQQQLLAVAVVDVLDNALSAVYTFYDPNHSSRSLGVLAVLWQIHYAQQHSLDYVYLGYWISDCRKMRYKSQYQPLQGWLNGNWQLLHNDS